MQITRTKKEQPRPPGFSPTRIQISQICNVRLVSIFFNSQCIAHFGVCVAKYRANIIHHFIFVFVHYFSYQSSWRSLSFAGKSVTESIWAAKSGESSFRSNSHLRNSSPRLFGKVLLFSFPVPVVGPSSRALAWTQKIDRALAPRLWKKLTSTCRQVYSRPLNSRDFAAQILSLTDFRVKKNWSQSRRLPASQTPLRT